MIRSEIIRVITTGPAGTVVSTRPVSGEIVSVRMSDTNLGGTADYTITRVKDGGTILTVTDGAAPWQYQPSNVAHTNGTAIAGTAIGFGVPCDDHLRVTVAQGTHVGGTADMYVLYRW